VEVIAITASLPLIRVQQPFVTHQESVHIALHLNVILFTNNQTYPIR